jgi:LysM repeat protein/ABC-type branched-subunit amino acid transport system substrate-binding protein
LVQKQETLYGISRKYNMTVDDILSVNPDFEGLKEGMELRIPKSKPVSKPAVKELTPVKVVKQENSPAEIIVKTGETLYSISKLYNTSVDNLIEWNPQLTEGLKAGMVLRIRKPDEKSLAKPEEAINPVNDEKPLSRGDCYKSSNIKATYQIALLLPLLLDEAEDVLSASEQKDATDFEGFNYFQFYAGFMLAADSLEKYGLNARIQVMDADKLNDTLTIRQALRKPGMDKMDLLVGPMYGSSFTIASRFAQKHKIGIINPLSRRESIVEGNPYVIKTQASGSGVAKKLASFIANTYPNANIIAVRNDTKEMKTLADEFISQVQDHIDRFSFSGSLQESVYATEMMNGVTKKLKAGVKNIVILFSNNKTTVPNFVSLLNPHAKINDIILMGMDGWEELDLETEFLVNLNFHQLTSSYIDYESEATQQFVTRFKNKYGALPQSTKHAFLGYDLGWYFLTSLMWNGDQFISCLPGYRVKGLQYNFNFAGSANGDGIQNQDITIVKLQDYKLIKVE